MTERLRHFLSVCSGGAAFIKIRLWKEAKKTIEAIEKQARVDGSKEV